MAQYAGPDGVAIDFPDTMSEDEVKAVMRRKFPAPAADAEPAGVLEPLKFQRAVAAYGGGLQHALRKAANWSFGMPSGPKAFSDEAVKEEGDILAPLAEQHPVAAGLGNATPGIAAGLAGPGVLSAAKGVLPRVAALAASGIGGGVQGAAFAEPGHRVEDAAMGTGLGVGLNALGQGGRAAMNAAEPFANRTALKLFQLSQNALDEVKDTFGKRGGLITDAFEAAGKKLREMGATNPFTGMARRNQIIAKHGDEVYPALKQTVADLDARGATVTNQGLVAELEALKDSMFGRPGSAQITEPLRSGRRHAEELIARVQAHPGLQTGAPLSQFEDAKRMLQDEGFLTGSAKYIESSAAEADPVVQFMRKASSIFRRKAEDAASAVDPALGTKFKALKQDAQMTMMGEKASERAAVREFAGPTEMSHVMPQTLPARKLTEAVLEHYRPFAIKGAEAVDLLGKLTPQNADDFWRAAMIEMLRSKEKNNAP
jgi:hypothetical protein